MPLAFSATTHRLGLSAHRLCRTHTGAPRHASSQGPCGQEAAAAGARPLLTCGAARGLCWLSRSQVSGVKFAFNPDQPPGKRIVPGSVFMCEFDTEPVPMEMDHKYKVRATTDAMPDNVWRFASRTAAEIAISATWAAVSCGARPRKAWGPPRPLTKLLV
jgi:hypothetical protein